MSKFKDLNNGDSVYITQDEWQKLNEKKSYVIMENGPYKFSWIDGSVLGLRKIFVVYDCESNLILEKTFNIEKAYHKFIKTME